MSIKTLRLSVLLLCVMLAPSAAPLVVAQDEDAASRNVAAVSQDDEGALNNDALVQKISPEELKAIEEGLAPEYKSAYGNRTPEEYRKLILDATSEAQIDAYVSQMIVQEKREKEGLDLPDEEFDALLDTPEIKADRRVRVDYWLKERSKVKDKSLRLDYKKWGTILGGLVVVLLLIVIVGAKRAPKDQSAETGK